jgi:hypothetical protein
MIVSASECRDMITKAGRGVGLEASRAVDLAAACCLLCASGRNGCQAALACLDAGSEMRLPEHPAAGQLFWGVGRAALEGGQAIEMIQAGLAQKAGFGHLDAPPVLLALAAILAPETGFELLAGETLQGRTAQGWIDWAKPEAALDGGEHPVWLRRLDSLPDIKARLEQPFSVPPQDWQALSRLAALTYVPESETSRAQGAGAGQIDND